MNKSFMYDYIVIGSGPAGSTAALELAKRKKKVAIIEGRYLGGANLNTRDVPYAVALDFAHNYDKILGYPEFRNQDFSFSLPTLAAHILKTITALGSEHKNALEGAGVTCIKGYANLLDEHTVAVGSEQFTAANFVLATGSRLKTLEIGGTDTVKYLTPESAIQIRRLPKVVAVVGGGSTGCEIANFYADLGAKVVIFETAERLLPKEDKEAGEALEHYFNTELKIMTLTSAKVVAIEQDKISRRVVFRQNNTEKAVRVESVILATGSQPVTDYGLENAGVKYKNSGIITDKYFQTSAKNIYAIGDALGNDSSTERATQEGLTLAVNLTSRSKTAMNYNGFIRVTKTSPEIATVGLNEDDLAKRDRGYKKAIVMLNDTVAGKIYHPQAGFVKLITDKNNRVIGATIMAPNAELMATELAMAIRHNLTALEVASTPHLINGYNYMLKLAAKKLAVTQKK